MWPVPASRIIILVAVETSGLHRTALFLCSVDDVWNTLAWPGSESSLSHKWKVQTGSLKTWPWFLHGMRLFSLYPAGISYPMCFIMEA